MNSRELLATVEDTWRQFDAAIEGLDEAALTEAGVVDQWSIKDLIGHVTAWEQKALQHVDRYRRGDAFTGDTTVDDYNASESARRRDWPLAKVLEESAETRQWLRTTLESLGEDEWSTPVGEGEREGPLGEWVGGALGGPTGPGTHAAEHARHIHEWRGARALNG
jgi:uncharacterized protein (TIGR03083 family)